jgi:hypothetical protein
VVGVDGECGSQCSFGETLRNRQILISVIARHRRTHSHEQYGRKEKEKKV